MCFKSEVGHTRELHVCFFIIIIIINFFWGGGGMGWRGGSARVRTRSLFNGCYISKQTDFQST